jgi:hypothetical protein
MITCYPRHRTHYCMNLIEYFVPTRDLSPVQTRTQVNASLLVVTCVCTIQTNRKHAQVYSKSPKLAKTFERVQSYRKSTQVTASWCSNETQVQSCVDLRNSRLNMA